MVLLALFLLYLRMLIVSHYVVVCAAASSLVSWGESACPSMEYVHYHGLWPSARVSSADPQFHQFIRKENNNSPFTIDRPHADVQNQQLTVLVTERQSNEME